MQWFLKALKNYVGFKGRARRKEYWMFILFSAIISLVLTVIELILGIPAVLTGLFSLAILLPSLAVTVRRLHDTGRSGWWLLVSLIPLLGSLLILIYTFMDSESGSNQYGQNPKFE
ncbi:DUF805 domain-containing protein [Bacillus sp. M6-12]|uniref:DUF805 domain-containing protein n=1 Tax=Bacillus sp. M6-12 TaxID=2054166 RepID=UPI000C788725|nr:DUF805 domain-containing protein [Bacillus sp. M6-12]PLS16066.1 DUF805 domain-containing protein [Bacillus sp. M6-12]